MYYSEDNSIWKNIGTIIICVIVMLFVISISQSCSRQENNMTYICDGYCYDNDTYIIYREMESGRYGTRLVYTAYYDEHGNLCRFNTETLEWIPIKE